MASSPRCPPRGRPLRGSSPGPFSRRVGAVGTSCSRLPSRLGSPACRRRFKTQEEIIMSVLQALWLPILLSSVFVFLASSIIHIALPRWHKGDYLKVPNEDEVMDAM